MEEEVGQWGISMAARGGEEASDVVFEAGSKGDEEGDGRQKKRRHRARRRAPQARPKPRLTSQNFYKVLGVSRRDSALQIRRSYRKLCLQFHPDKNQDEESATQFALLSVAMHTLGDAKLRAMYDAQLDQCAAVFSAMGSGRNAGRGQGNAAAGSALPSIEGFEALSVWSRYESREAMELLAKVPEIEETFQLACSLRFREGVPCDGLSCVTDVHMPLLRILDPKFLPSPDATLLLCVKHSYLHLCEAACVTDDERCPMLAMWQAERWHRAMRKERASAAASLKEHNERVLKHNRRRKMPIEAPQQPKPIVDGSGRLVLKDELASQQEKPKEKEAARTDGKEVGVGMGRLEEVQQASDEQAVASSGEAAIGVTEEEVNLALQRECLRETCEESDEHPERGFVKLADGVWVCRQHPRPHICSMTSCRLLKADRLGDMYCWASQRWYRGLVAADLHAAGQHVPEQRAGSGLGVSLNGRKRMMSWVDEKTLEKHELIVDVPWGMEMGEEIEEFEQHPIALLAKRHQQRLAAGSSQAGGTNQAITCGKRVREPEKEWEEPRKKRRKTKQADMEPDEEADSDDAEEDAIFDDVAVEGVYHTYVMDHDVRAEDREVGDYRTVLAGRLGLNEAEEAAEEELLVAAGEEMHEADELLALLSAAEAKEGDNDARARALGSKAEAILTKLSTARDL